MKSEGVSLPLHQKEIKNLHYADFQNIEFPVSNPDGVTKRVSKKLNFTQCLVNQYLQGIFYFNLGHNSPVLVTIWFTLASPNF